MPLTLLLLILLILLAPKLVRRVQLSRAKHRSLNGHSRIAKFIARQVPFFEHSDDEFFSVDGAPAAEIEKRQAGFDRLSELYRSRFKETAAFTTQAATDISDLQFTSRYRVPYQFSRVVRTALSSGVFASRAEGVHITDLDGNEFYDLTGSYGVNVFGTDFYRRCIEEANRRAAPLGPALGLLHPIVADNAQRLCNISGLDEVSFHMSGTEAVMQAVRLARYHTKRRKLVRFSGAYHGWWEDVQPGVGNPLPPRDVYTLCDMSERSLKVLDTRRDIACVLVNPLQALHPNSSAPGDSTLIDSSRQADFHKAAYRQWLHKLRGVCTRRGIVLIFDEVFVGFRLAPGGAQQYFGVKADMVTYGKTLGGGYPVGVVCGLHRYMKRYSDERPADVCFARGTFNSHPYVMAAMQVFLERLETPQIREMYVGLDDLWNSRVDHLNARFAEANLPVQFANMSSIWTVFYTRPSAYNWMFQYYLKAEGLALSWIGTGRLIFSLNFSDAEFSEVADRIVKAAQTMAADGWWWAGAELTNQTIRRRVLRNLVHHRVPWFVDA